MNQWFRIEAFTALNSLKENFNSAKQLKGKPVKFGYTV